MSNEQHIPLGKRLARFVGLIGTLFAITAGIIVTQKLSEDALALIVGLSCGVMAMVPTLALGILILKRERNHAHAERFQERPQSGYPQSPPVIVVTPQALPSQNGGRYANPYYDDGAWAPNGGQREFTIVGQDE